MRLVPNEFNKNKILQWLKSKQSDSNLVSVKILFEKTTTLTVRNEKSENTQIGFDHGFRVEVLANGHIGYCGTTDFSIEGLERAYLNARELTLHLTHKKAHSFPTSVRPAQVGQYQSQIQNSLDRLSISEIQKVLLECTSNMKLNDALFYRMAQAIIVECEDIRLDSNGSDIQQNFSIVNIDLIARAQNGSEIQSRSYNSCLQIGAEAFLRSKLLPLSEQIAKDALELIKAPNCPKDTRDLILSPDQMALQIHESVGHPLEVDRILGDERNYAGWSFVKTEDFGQLKYGSEKMNITFEPDRFSELASYHFDDSGKKAEKEYLIKNGLLLQGLGGLESEQRSLTPSVANFRSSSWNRPPIDRMANLNLQSGTISLKDMIGKIEKGILMMTNRSWSIDDYRRKFQFGCEYGQLIENGELKNIVKNPNYHGISVPFWNQLADVSNEFDTFGSFYCGKGEPNQIIRVGHSSPFAWFKDIEIF